MSSWRSLLLRIGDKSAEYNGSSDVEEHIETCYSVMWKELDYSEDDILSFLMQCVEQLPHKMPMYGTLVGLLNLENEEIVKKVLENLQKELQAAVDSGDCNKIRILLRFVTVLMCNSVLQSGAVVELYEALLSFAATSINDEAGNPAWQARADFYVTCVLSCLPWGGAELIEQAPDEFGRVLALIETYFNIRRHCYDASFSVFSPKDVNSTNPDEKDFLEDLWDRVQSMQSNGWKVDSVPRPHLLFESRLVAGTSHEFGPINCPEQPDFPMSQSEIESSRQMHEAQMKCPCRLRRIHIFPKSKAEENMQPIDRFVVEEYLLDVLLFFNGCRKECASYMVGLPVPFRYEYLMAETLFSQLLLLPEPPFKPIYYTLVIIDLCKALPGAFPAVVAAAVRVLFDRIADMDMECRHRLILWFSHHLSNFQFIWPWEDWSYVLDLPNWAPQRVFVQEVLERETRLSYREKIKQSVENVSVLEELLPPVSGPCFKYSGEDSADTPEHGLSSELKAMVRGKKTSRDIISWLEGKIMPEHGPKLALEVVSQTFLDIGAKSFTHLITVLERYGQVIARLCPDQDNQVTLIEEISMFWKNSSQLTSITIDRMMGYRLISNLAIVRWVFSPANVRQFHVSDRPWEVLRNALDKTCNRISDLRKEIKLLESGIISVKEATSKAQAELESAETRLVIRDGEPVVAEAPVRLKRLKSYVDKAKEEEVSAHESLEAKQALLSRAHVESETLFIAMYKNLSDILVKGFPSLLGNKHGYPLELQHDDSMIVDSEEPKRDLNLNGVSSGYDVKETDQWRLCVLGYVNAFSRKYASEIWVHIQKLDEEVLAKDPSSQLLKAVYSGLCRPLSV